MVLVGVPVSSLSSHFKSHLTKFMSCYSFLYGGCNFVINELCVFSGCNVIDPKVHDQIKLLEFYFTSSCFASIEKCEHQFWNSDLRGSLLDLNLFVEHEEGIFLVFSSTEAC